ncbi:MAG: phosphatase PAP2 family protein [Patescibacteria group bacterium]
MTLDYQLFQILHSLAGKYWLMDGLAVFFAEYLPYLLLLVFLFLIFFTHRNWQSRRYFIFFSVFSALLARGLFVEIIRFFYYRPRPFITLDFEPLIGHVANGAMPSGHATMFFALATLMFFINKKHLWYFLLGALLISIGRIVVGVHWPLDVVVGAVIGVISVVAARMVISKCKV